MNEEGGWQRHNARFLILHSLFWKRVLQTESGYGHQRDLVWTYDAPLSQQLESRERSSRRRLREYALPRRQQLLPPDYASVSYCEGRSSRTLCIALRDWRSRGGVPTAIPPAIVDAPGLHSVSINSAASGMTASAWMACSLGI